MGKRIFRGFLFLGRQISSRNLSPNFFFSYLWEKSAQKNPPGKSSKFYTAKIPDTFLQRGRANKDIPKKSKDQGRSGAFAFQTATPDDEAQSRVTMFGGHGKMFGLFGARDHNNLVDHDNPWLSQQDWQERHAEPGACEASWSKPCFEGA